MTILLLMAHDDEATRYHRIGKLRPLRSLCGVQLKRTRNRPREAAAVDPSRRCSRCEEIARTGTDRLLRDLP